MRICMVGTDYAGLVTGVCLTENGNDVWCVDKDESKILKLQPGRIPIYGPGLEEIVKSNVAQGRLRLTTMLEDGITNGLFISVGTPPNGDRPTDLQFVCNVAREIGRSMDNYKTIVHLKENRI